MKKVLSALLALVLALSLLTPMTALAEDSFDWEANDWVYRYYPARGVARLKYYHGNAENLVIPDHIGAIPVEGFADVSAVCISNPVKTITFELQVTEIPKGFADGCTTLESVTLPDSVHTIKPLAFYGCTALTTINMPPSLQTIGERAFEHCDSLNTLILPASVQTIGERAFVGCFGLQSVTLNTGLQSIGKDAFVDCRSLVSVTVPETVNSIGQSAFAGCTDLESAQLPSELKVIPEELFLNCRRLTTVNLPSGLYSIRDKAFSGCSTLNKVTLPSGLSYLGTQSFYNCINLAAIAIPGSVGIISKRAFYNCDNLATVNIGYGVHTIEKEAFSGCGYSGGTITLPHSVITVGNNAFYNVANKYLDGEKRFLDRIDFENVNDKLDFHYRVPIYFESAHGTLPSTLKPYNGETVTLPTMTAQGYTFNGWQVGNDIYTNTYTVGNDAVTLTAKWTPLENTVTFVSDKGSVPPAQTVLSGNKVTEPATQIVGDEHLEGWYTDSSFTNRYNFGEAVDHSFTLYAKWSSATQVTVNLTGGGSYNSVNFIDNHNGSVFATLTASGTLYLPSDAKMVISAASGYNFGGSIEAEHIDANGASTMYHYGITNGTAVYQPDFGDAATVNITFTATPRVFTNIVGDDNLNTGGLWSLTDGYGNAYANGSAVTVPDGMIAPEQANLTLALTVPSGYGCDGTIVNGSTVIPVYDGTTSYTFLPEGTVTVSLHYYSRSAYTTLLFCNADGSRSFSQKYAKDETTFTVPDCPYSKSGAVFSHWAVGSTEYTVGDTAALPASDTAFTSVWENAYFITLNKNGGTGTTMPKQPATQNNNYETTVPECTYTRSGKAFAGWNTKANGSGTTYQPGDAITLSGNTTLYAQWTDGKAVYLYPNGGSGDTLHYQIPTGSTYTVPDCTFTLTHYEFAGWNTNPDGSGTAYAVGDTVTINTSLQLYAQWTGDDGTRDYAALAAALERAAAFNADDYTPDSFNALTATCALYADYENLGLRQYQVDNATAAVLTAISELVPYLTLNIVGSWDMVNFGNESAQELYSLPFGYNVTLNAVSYSNRVFKGWYNTVSHRIESTDTTYTFPLTANTSLKALFTVTATLTFVTDDGFIAKTMSSNYMTAYWTNMTSEELVASEPPVPYRVGYTNGRWDYDAETVLAALRAGTDVTVTAVYDAVEDAYEAPDIPEPTDTAPALNLYYQLDAENNVGTFTLAAGIPTGCMVDSIGIAFFYKGAKSFNPMNFDLTINNKITASTFPGYTESGTYIVDVKKFTAAKNWAARGYVTYYENGELKIAYSNQINIINRQQIV